VAMTCARLCRAELHLRETHCETPCRSRVSAVADGDVRRDTLTGNDATVTA